MKANLWALALLLPLTLSLGCAASYKERINQQLWEREMRLMEDCNYRLKWQIEDMQHALDDANARIQTLTKETGTLRDRGSSTGPDLTLPPALRSPNGTGRDSEAPTLPPRRTRWTCSRAGNLARVPRDARRPCRQIPARPRRSTGSTITMFRRRVLQRLPAGNRCAEDRLDPDANVERIVLNPVAHRRRSTRKINRHRAR